MWFSNSSWARQISQVQNTTKGSLGTIFLTLEAKTDLHGGVFVCKEILILELNCNTFFCVSEK